MSIQESFLDRFDFALDPFQVQAMESLDKGRSVLVAAPTGAGKTIVGEYAIHRAVQLGFKVFYTAPIKALSNQKYAELCEWLGHNKVGLVTGDVSINSEAQVVVMTTEILRNMMYADSPTMHGLGYVVMDEVHYLADRMRGPVWEEIIIHLPLSVQIVALSATVSNVEEFGAWLTEVRGHTDVIVSERRPTPLWQHVLHDGDLLDVFIDEDGNPTPSHGPEANRRYREVNPALSSIGSDPHVSRSGRRPRGERSGRRGYRDRRSHVHDQVMKKRPMGRADVVHLLEGEGLLPAIFFIFSRQGCDQAVAQLVRSRVSLTSDAERAKIRSILDTAFRDVRPDDFDALGLEHVTRAALHGFAAHHAGQLPLVKAVIEELFVKGLVKVVCATETLALGINMPARTVVLEKLTKFNGTEHAKITPGEFTQLTGRAGRRGIDVEGHAVVIVPDRVLAADVAGLASTRTYRLVSAFRPTYNMTVNLLQRFSVGEARKTLESSFAQFHTDRGVVSQARKARELEETVEKYAGALSCELGDVREYAEILESITQREKELNRAKATKEQERLRTVVGKLRRGDIVAIPGGRRQGYAVVITHEKTVRGPLVHVLTDAGQLREYYVDDFSAAPMVLGTMRVMSLDRFSQGRVRRDTASALREKLRGEESPRESVRSRVKVQESTPHHDRVLAKLRESLREHPCHSCPDREAHIRWVSRYRKAIRERDRALRSITERTSYLGRQFDSVLRVLDGLGYVQWDADTDTAVVEPKGHLLQRIFSDRDLLVCESLNQGVWDELKPAALAAVASALCFEARRDEAGYSDIDDRSLSRALYAMSHLVEDINLHERRAGLPLTPAPETGLVGPVYRWAKGKSFAQSIDNAPISPGDFVRHVRQVIDLLDHVSKLREPRFADISDVAHKARTQLLRGIVAQDM